MKYHLDLSVFEEWTTLRFLILLTEKDPAGGGRYTTARPRPGPSWALGWYDDGGGGGGDNDDDDDGGGVDDDWSKSGSCVDHLRAQGGPGQVVAVVRGQRLPALGKGTGLLGTTY